MEGFLSHKKCFGDSFLFLLLLKKSTSDTKHILTGELHFEKKKKEMCLWFFCQTIPIRGYAVERRGVLRTVSVMVYANLFYQHFTNDFHSWTRTLEEIPGAWAHSLMIIILSVCVWLQCYSSFASKMRTDLHFLR